MSLEEGPEEAEIAWRYKTDCRGSATSWSSRWPPPSCARATHRDVLDDVRRAKALALLREGMATADVATAAGFRGADAFYRAHCRWTGESIENTAR